MLAIKKATDIFKELVEKGLIMDVRVGQGKPNRIYIVKPEVSEHQARNFVDEENARCAEMTALESDEVGDTEEMLECDTQKQQVKKRQNDISRSTEMTGQEASKKRTLIILIVTRLILTILIIVSQ